MNELWKTTNETKDKICTIFISKIRDHGWINIAFPFDGLYKVSGDSGRKTLWNGEYAITVWRNFL